MSVRIGLVVLLASLLAGCGMLQCGSAGDGRQAAGACGAHTTFLRNP